MQTAIMIEIWVWQVFLMLALGYGLGRPDGKMAWGTLGVALSSMPVFLKAIGIL